MKSFIFEKIARIWRRRDLIRIPSNVVNQMFWEKTISILKSGFILSFKNQYKAEFVEDFWYFSNPKMKLFKLYCVGRKILGIPPFPQIPHIRSGRWPSDPTGNSVACIPTHIAFLNYAVCMYMVNQLFGIWTILSALLNQRKLKLQKATWFKPRSPFPNFFQRDNMQHFPRPYLNILPFTTTFMKRKQQHASNPKVLFSIFFEKTA